MGVMPDSGAAQSLSATRTTPCMLDHGLEQGAFSQDNSLPAHSGPAEGVKRVASIAADSPAGCQCYIQVFTFA